jgi:hypothetical protein
LLQIALHWQGHHREHAAALAAEITRLGGAPVAAADVIFTAPAWFAPSVLNVLKLACNAERVAAISYNRAVGALEARGSRYVAGAIQGTESQHFTVLYAILKGTAQPGPAIAAMVDQIVATAFVSPVGGARSLQDVPDLAYD